MGDLLKKMRSSQIFSVCGLPDVKVSKSKTRSPGPKSKVQSRRRGSRFTFTDHTFQVELLGLDTFDPVTMEADHLKAAEVPGWFLDTDYNGWYSVRQAFFPRTGAWENLKKSLRMEFEDTSGSPRRTTSAPFPAGEHGQWL